MRKVDKNAPITLTGRILDYYADTDQRDRTTELVARDATPDDPEGEIIEFAGSREVYERIKFERGDIALRPKLDAGGRQAVRGGHANYGYSGYFEASVFDGKAWRAFNIRNLPEHLRNYMSQLEKNGIEEQLGAFLLKLEGVVVEWGIRAYQLPQIASPGDPTLLKTDTPA